MEFLYILETLSSNSVSSLMDALKVCDGLEFLSLINKCLTEMSQHIPEPLWKWKEYKIKSSQLMEDGPSSSRLGLKKLE